MSLGLNEQERAVEEVKSVGLEKYVNSVAIIKDPASNEQDFRIALQTINVFVTSGLSVFPKPLDEFVAAMIANHTNHERFGMITAIIREHDIKEFIDNLLEVARGGGTTGLYTVDQRCRLLEEAAVLVDRLVVREIDCAAIGLDVMAEPPANHERTGQERTRIIERIAGILHDESVRKTIGTDGRFDRGFEVLRQALKIEKKERPRHDDMMGILGKGNRVARDAMKAERTRRRT